MIFALLKFVEKIYLTKKGFKKIKADYRKLRETIEKSSWQRQRLAELEYILANAKEIKNPSPERQNRVYLGATVLVDVGGQTDEFTILGSLEANPVGKALLGKKVGDVITVSFSFQTTYKIKKIRYPLRS